ncbi:hypothetical protein VULLAG_LOCUS9265 [Vulpes lagopus]
MHAEARCRRRELREDEVGVEERACPPWAGGAAGRQEPCGCARPCTRAAPRSALRQCGEGSFAFSSFCPSQRQPSRGRGD